MSVYDYLREMETATLKRDKPRGRRERDYRVSDGSVTTLPFKGYFITPNKSCEARRCKNCENCDNLVIN